MARTLEEIDADIAKFQAALDDLLLGNKAQTLKHNGRERTTETGSNRAGDIRRRLLELQHERSRISGERSPFAPIIPPIMS